MYPTQPDPRRATPGPLMWDVGLVAISAPLLLAACGESSSGAGASPTATTAPTATATPVTRSAAATITMDEFNFTGTTHVTIKAGQAVKFDDTQGGPHVLVIGTNGVLEAKSGAP